MKVKLYLVDNDKVILHIFSVDSDRVRASDRMGCCCTCNIVCVGLLSILLTSPLLAPVILANISSLSSLTQDVDNSTTASSSLLHTGLAWLHVIPENSLSDEVIDQATKKVIILIIKRKKIIVIF